MMANEETSRTEPGAKKDEVRYVQYDGNREEEYIPAIRQLISKDLSEPYSIYVYRYFLYQWGELCYTVSRGQYLQSMPARCEDDDNDGRLIDPGQAFVQSRLIGVVVSKLEQHKSGTHRGYIAMLAVEAEHRGQGIATRLVRLAIDAMAARGADEIALETEVTNSASLRLYQRLGFLRSKKLHRYYLNGNNAFRLILSLKVPDPAREQVGRLASGSDGNEAEEEHTTSGARPEGDHHQAGLTGGDFELTARRDALAVISEH